MTSSSLTVASLLADPRLGLTAATGDLGLDRPIMAAHVTELVRPGPWLQGGELLMTIGLLLPMTDDDCEAYVEDAAQGEVAALGIGLGAQLPHRTAPAPLVRAAARHGVPLLVVPDRTPFIAVTKAVFAALAADERRDVAQALELDRRLTAAAAAGRGVDGLLDAWRRARGGAASVLDVAGRRIGGGGDHDPDDVRLAELVATLRHRGLRSSASLPAGDGRTELHPLGATHVGGVLVLRTDADRRAVSTLRALLSLELERRYLADADARRARAEVVGLLLDPATPAEAAAHHLALAGVGGGDVRVVVVEADEHGGQALAADLALALRGGLVRVHSGAVEAVTGADVDARTLLARFAPGRAAGIGPAGPVESLPASRRDALGCLPASRRRGEPVEAEGSGSVGLLLRLGAPDAVAAFADRVLGPLRTVDRSGSLESTLAAWLDCGGSLERTAESLGVHRHTVRSRLDRVEAALGRRLDDPHARHEVWLAVQAAGVLATPERGQPSIERTSTRPSAGP